jgi:hypothetical protein
MITQLNATYVPLEDRVLFKFNTADASEFRLWLTRNMVLQIMSVCSIAAVKVEELAHPVAQAQSIAEFKQQAVEQATTFTEYKPASVCPLGEEPVLVNRLHMRIEGKQYVLVLGLVIGKDLTLRLNEDLLAKMRLLLNTIQEKAQWGLVVNQQLSLATDAIAPDDALPASALAKMLH